MARTGQRRIRMYGKKARGPNLFKILKLLFSSAPKSRRSEDDVPYESAWLRWESDDYHLSEPEGLVKLTGATDVAVAGTSFRLEECKIVISALKGNRANSSSLNLVHEEDSVDHPHAMAVFVKLRHRDCQIGYLPSDVADMIAHSFSKDMPLRATLRSWGQKKSGDAVFFRICLFVPAAKDRKKFVLRREE